MSFFLYSFHLSDVYFVREYDTTAKCVSESTRSDYQRRASYAGFKFEQVVTVNDLGEKPDTSAPVDQNNEFIGMFKCTKTHNFYS